MKFLVGCLAIAGVFAAGKSIGVNPSLPEVLLICAAYVVARISDAVFEAIRNT